MKSVKKAYFSADGQRDQQTNTDMMKVIVTFCNCANVPKNSKFPERYITSSLVQFSYR